MPIGLPFGEKYKKIRYIKERKSTKIKKSD